MSGFIASLLALGLGPDSRRQFQKVDFVFSNFCKEDSDQHLLFCESVLISALNYSCRNHLFLLHFKSVLKHQSYSKKSIYILECLVIGISCYCCSVLIQSICLLLAQFQKSALQSVMLTLQGLKMQITQMAYEPYQVWKSLPLSKANEADVDSGNDPVAVVLHFRSCVSVRLQCSLKLIKGIQSLLQCKWLRFV